MPATIVSDTSCLILLDKIGELHLLQYLFGLVLIPQAVAAEFEKTLPGWVSVENPTDKKCQAVLATTLDMGEASAIALALEKGDCLLIIDELKGRKIANQLGLTITGTLGVLAQAKQRGYIKALRPLFEKIRNTDFRLSERLVEEILKETGE